MQNIRTKKKPTTEKCQKPASSVSCFFHFFFCCRLLVFLITGHTSLFPSGKPVLLVRKINGQLGSVVIASVDRLSVLLPTVRLPHLPPPAAWFIGMSYEAVPISWHFTFDFEAFEARACYQWTKSWSVIPHNGYWQLLEIIPMDSNRWKNVSSILRAYTSNKYKSWVYIFVWNTHKLKEIKRVLKTKFF